MRSTGGPYLWFAPTPCRKEEFAFPRYSPMLASAMRKRVLCLGIIVSVSVLRGQQPQPTPPTPPTTYIAPNQIHFVVDDPALREALVKWLDAQSSPSTTQPLEIRLLEPTLQSAIADRLRKDAAKSSETGVKAWVSANSGALGVCVGALIGLTSSVIVTWISTKKQQERESKLQADRYAAEDRRDKNAAENAIARDQAAAAASLAHQTALANLAAAATRELESLRAEIATKEAVRKARFERLEKFHAPLRALFQQSRGLTNKLYHHIYAKRKDGRWEGRKIIFRSESELANPTDLDELTLQAENAPQRRIYIVPDNPAPAQQPITLRMLDFMPLLLEDPEAKLLVDEILAIGGKIAEVISTYGGLAAAGEEPSPVYGEYLAHLAILRAVRKNPPDPETCEPGLQKIGYYPRGLDAEVELGYRNAKAAVEGYEDLK